MKKDRVIIVGGTRKIKDNLFKKCHKCGKKTTISGKNLERAKQKDVEIYCPDCGLKVLGGKGEDKVVNFPTEAEMDTFLEKYVGEHLLKKFITKTLYRKKCNSEFGHETITGAMMINKNIVGFKSPANSKELAKSLKFSIKKVKGRQAPPPPPPTRTMVS